MSEANTSRCQHAMFGTPGRIRTCDLRIRSPTLYPAELRAHIGFIRTEPVFYLKGRESVKGFFVFLLAVRLPTLPKGRFWNMIGS